VQSSDHRKKIGYEGEISSCAFIKVSDKSTWVIKLIGNNLVQMSHTSLRISSSVDALSVAYSLPRSTPLVIFFDWIVILQISHNDFKILHNSVKLQQWYRDFQLWCSEIARILLYALIPILVGCLPYEQKYYNDTLSASSIPNLIKSMKYHLIHLS